MPERIKLLIMEESTGQAGSVVHADAPVRGRNGTGGLVNHAE